MMTLIEKIKDLWNMLNGMKTYIIAGTAIVYLWSQVWSGAIDTHTAIEGTLAALGGMTMRQAVSQNAKKTDAVQKTVNKL